MRFSNSFVTCVALLCLAGAICAQPTTLVGECLPSNALETFDTWTFGTAATGCGTTGSSPAGPFPGGAWPGDPADTNCWRVYNMSPPSYNGNGFTTGDHTTGTGNFLYTEATGTAAGAVGTLYLRFDTTGIANPTIEMWTYTFNLNFNFNANMGDLTVDYWGPPPGGGLDGWQNVLLVSDDPIDGWVFQQLPVVNNVSGDPVNGQIGCGATEVLIRIMSVTGAGFESDIRVDDIICKDLSQPEYEVNTSAADLTIDGVQGSQFAPTVVTKNTVACFPTAAASGTLSLSSDQTGALWEVVTDTDPLVSSTLSGVFPIVMPEMVNLDVLNAPFVSNTTLNGGPGLNLTFDPFPLSSFPGATGGTLAVPWTLTNLPAGVISMQGVVLHAAAPIGFDLTQATQLVIASTGIPGVVCPPEGDDASVAIDVTLAPLSSAGITFYDTTYTTIYPTTNGRVKFNNGITSFTPTAVDALLNEHVGIHMDMDQGLGGSVAISSPVAGVVQVSYVNVPHWGAAGSPGNTFDIILDSNGPTFDITLGGLTGVDQSVAPGSDVFMGMSAGTAGFTLGAATDSLTTLFTQGTTGGTPAFVTDMLYDFGAAGAFPPSLMQLTPLQTLTFTNGGPSGYTWTAAP